MSFLGIDLGTSGLRVLLLDEGGAFLASSESEYEIHHPHSGWSEQNPYDWIEALEKAIADIQLLYPQFKELQAIAVAGQMHGATLLDRNGIIIRPCILWNDTRSKEQAEVLDAHDRVRDLSGNIVFPGFTAPKLEWIKRYEPDNYERIAKVLLPAGFLNYYLTGDFVADLSDSAGTTWLDVHQRAWSAELLMAGSMSQEQMPQLFEGCRPAGILRKEIQEKWELKSPVVIAAGAGDNAAAACGMGIVEEGQGFVSLGTSGVLLAARNGYHPAPQTSVHTFCHALPDRWYQMGVMLSATDSLNWLAGIVEKSPEDLTQEVGTVLEQPGDLTFLPYLSGERTPHNDVEIRGTFMGLGINSGRKDLTQAVMQGVAFALKDSQQALFDCGAKPAGLYVIGGGSRSRYWIQLIATVFNLPLYLAEQGEFGVALGAARLAMIAVGTQKGLIEAELIEAIMTQPRIIETIYPDQRLIEVYESAYRRFRKSYPAIKSIDCQ